MQEGERLTISEAISHWQGLHQRFMFLTELRTTTARRHITIIGAVGAFVMFSFNKETVFSPEFIPLASAITSFIMLVMGYCVTAYDWRIRERANIVAREIEDVVVKFNLVEGSKRNDRDKLDEDKWFFSQIAVANAITLVVFLNSLVVYLVRAVGNTLIDITAWYFLLGDVALFFLFWTFVFWLWKYKGKEYAKKIGNWTPV